MSDGAKESAMNFFSENVDAWGAAEWFDRMAKAIREQDKAVLAKNELAFETCKNVAASSAMRLVRDYENEVRIALKSAPAQSNGDEGDARCTTIIGSWSNNAELIALCMDMLGDVPGETLDYKVEKLVSYHLEMQVMLSEASARLAKATAALEDLALQKTLAEMEAEDEGAEDRADFVGAYDAMIGIARTALKDIQS